MKMIRLVFVMGFVLGISCAGLTEEGNRSATIIDLKGTVEVKTPKQAWKAAKIEMVVNQGDIIRTKANSSAVLNLDGLGETAIMEVKANSQLKLAELMENKKERSQATFLDLALGEILIKARKLHSEKSKFEVKTPTSIVGVRGTTFSVTVEAVE